MRRRPRDSRIVVTTIVTLAALTATVLSPRPSDSAEQTRPLDAQIEGVEGDLERNVRATVEIVKRNGDRLPESDAYALHERAEQQIRKALEPYGFYRAIVRPRFEPEAGRWRAHYAIEPGPPLHVDSLDLRILGEGADDVPFLRFVERFPLPRGSVLVHPTWERAKAELVDIAMSNGYLDARLVATRLDVDLVRYGATVVLHYDTGTQYRFGPVEFRQDVVNPKLLRGYVTFDRGRPVDMDELIELEQELVSSPYFSRVEVRPRTDLARGAELPIVVDLLPAKRAKYTVGVGFGTDHGPHAQGRIELRRLNRRGHRAEIEATVAPKEHTSAVRYLVPWPYPRTDLVTFSAGYNRLETETTREETGRVGVAYSHLRERWQETYAVHYRRERFTVGSDQDLAGFLVPEASWTWLRYDAPIDPRDARRLRFRVAGAEQALFSAASFLRAEAGGKWIRALGGRNRLIGRLDLGSTWTGAFRQLPPSARFFAGGAQSVRGFEFNALGPRDALGNVIGGEALAVASIEYENRFFEHWGAAVFWDIGNAMHRFGDALEQGAGVGLRWLSPVGPVRTDFAFPLTEPGRRLHLHVSIGSAL